MGYIFSKRYIGAAIGATAAYVTTRLQLKNAKNLDLDRRLFDARSKLMKLRFPYSLLLITSDLMEGLTQSFHRFGRYVEDSQ